MENLDMEKTMPVEISPAETDLAVDRAGKPLPPAGAEPKALPIIGKPENTVKIGNEMIEIKPTKVSYQRDRTAAFYKMLEIYPLPDLLAMSSEAMGDPDRDGDKCVMDWLIAATDNPELILKHYDEMDTEIVENILAIFKRLNKITEKEERLKKLQEAKGVRA